LKRLRVALETQFGVGTATGLGVYATGLADGLRAHGGVEVIELRDPRFDLWRFDRRVYWDQVRAPSLAARSGADVLHFTGGTLPLRKVRWPVVLTLHDLVWLRGANRGRFYVRWYFGTLQPALARRADALVVDSQWAQSEIADGLRVDPGRLFVGGVGVDDDYFTIRRQPSEPPFALCVGTVEERKDLATAARALALVPDLRLLSVGPLTTYADEVRRVAASCGVSERLELRGYVDRKALLDLFGRASLLVFPSRYEGFGLPPLQALACGLPVAAARIPVTEEILGDYAWYSQPGDADGLADSIRAIVGGAATTEDAERGRARARGWSWASVADRMAGLYRRLA
jgi:glycosyltransferase involved in cell wall biosynthesis